MSDSKKLKGTKTEANLFAAFAGESQAYTKYGYYAKKAKSDGYVQIGKLFEETANNEKAHAKIWFKLINDGTMPGTEKNLTDAAASTASSTICSFSSISAPFYRECPAPKHRNGDGC